MKSAPLLLLLVASSAPANDREWRRVPITPRSAARSSGSPGSPPLPKCELEGVVESERVAMNQQAMLQYNRVLPIPLPLMPTPDVAPPARRGIHRFFR